MASAAKAVQGLKHVKPIFSTNHIEARRRVFALYRTWYRQLQLIGNLTLTHLVYVCYWDV